VVVDDDADLRGMLVILLQYEQGMRVIGDAGTAAELEAIMAAGQEPAVVLLDLHMPDTTAADVVARIRSVWSGARIVVYSGEDEAMARSHLGAVALHGVSFVTKGDPRELLEHLRSLRP